MLENIKLEDILFVDIETVSQKPDFQELNEIEQQLWEQKSAFLRKDGQTACSVYDRAAIYAEFGKIVCISVGYIIKNPENILSFRMLSFYDDDEFKLLNDFSQTLSKFAANRPNMQVCAHNGKEFDFPYIARRMLINKIQVHKKLDVAGKKPWEVPFIDTMELWRFGDYKSYTSLNLLTHVFGIPSPKDDISGAQVGEVYWKENDLQRIVRYCEKDVLSIAQLLLCYKNMNLIEAENVYSTTKFS
jgi:DNA polymerase elongation subunit (family B)